MERKAFGLVGPISSGIWVVFDYLKEQGYHYYSLSDDLRADPLAKQKRSGVTEREHWGWVGNTLRTQQGTDILARKALERVFNEARPKIIIDSIRHPDEVRYIQSQIEGIVMIGMNAPVRARHKLSILRGRVVDPVDFEEFRRLDRGEFNGGDSAAQDINAALKLVDILFRHRADNEEALGRLRRRVVRRLTSLAA